MDNEHEEPETPLEYEPSPVPADADLWPGELPFTAWGQREHGSLDLRVFDQGVWWVDIAQRPHRILTEMSALYIDNVIAFLLENAAYFHNETMRRDVLQWSGDLLLGRVPADFLAHELGAPGLTDLSPVEWLESTALMRALRRRAHALGTGDIDDAGGTGAESPD